MIIAFLKATFLFAATLATAYLVRYYIFTLVVLRKIKKPQKTASAASPKHEPSVSILIPTHNEETVISQLLQRMGLTYPKDKLQIIIINDASSDETGQIAEEYSRRCECNEVLHRDKNAGGKGTAAALNFSLGYAKGEIVLCFDADYYTQKDIVEKLVKEFADPIVGAVQGRPVVLNESQSVVTRLVTLERIGGYRIDQEARDALGLIPQFGGTVGSFRLSILEELGGFDESMLAEDTDLTFQIYLAGFKIRYVADAECYEEAVANWKAYWRQRHRWALGHMQVCFKNAFGVLKSRKLNFKEKIGGLLILHVYFMIVIALPAFIAGALLIYLSLPRLFTHFGF